MVSVVVFTCPTPTTAYPSRFCAGMTLGRRWAWHVGPGRKSSRSWALIGWMLGQPRRFSVELCQSSTPQWILVVQICFLELELCQTAPFCVCWRGWAVSSSVYFPNMFFLFLNSIVNELILFLLTVTLIKKGGCKIRVEKREEKNTIELLNRGQITWVPDHCPFYFFNVLVQVSCLKDLHLKHGLSAAFFIHVLCFHLWRCCFFSLGCTWFTWIAFGKLHLLSSKWLYYRVGCIYFHGFICVQNAELYVAFQLATVTEIMVALLEVVFHFPFYLSVFFPWCNLLTVQIVLCFPTFLMMPFSE